MGEAARDEHENERGETPGEWTQDPLHTAGGAVAGDKELDLPLKKLS